MHALQQTITSAVALCAGLLLVAGCQSDDNEGTQPIPPAETTTSEPPNEPPSTSPSTPAPTEPAWQDKYSSKEIAAYDEALDRFATYEQRSEPIWRRGKATPAAEQLFQEYFPDPVWRSYYGRLETYEEVNVKVEGIPEVQWSKAETITGNALSVVIVQCVDYSTVRTTQNGEPTKPIERFQRPLIRTISLSKPEGFNWLVYGLDDLLDGKAKPCDPEL